MTTTEGEGPLPTLLPTGPDPLPRSAAEARILGGPVVPTLLRLTGPVLISMVLYTLFNLVDSMWVGRLGAAPLAAVTTSMFASWILLGIAHMIATGVTAVVARQVGAGDRAAADHAAAQGLILATLFALVFALASRNAAPWLFTHLSSDPEVTRAGIAYLGPLLTFSLPFFLSLNLEAILRAHGDTRTPMIVTTVAVLFNLVFDPVLIFGLGPFPEMGVAGAAYATVTAQALAALLLWLHLTRRRSQFRDLPRSLSRPDGTVMAQILRIGGPTSVSTVLFSFVYLFLSRVAGQLGTDALAILGVGNRLESLCYLTADSLSIATATMVGQNLGAGNIARAKQVGQKAAGLSLALASSLGLIYFVFGPQMFRLFTADPAVVENGGMYMKILAVSQPIMGVEIVLSGVFAGAGYTLAPTWISISTSLLRVPLAQVFALDRGFGLAGLGWVITLTCMLRGLLLYGLYRRDRWTRTRL